jgi:hypothetical protein
MPRLRVRPPAVLFAAFAAITIAAACVSGCCAPAPIGGTGAKGAPSAGATSGAGAASSEVSFTTQCYVRAVNGPAGGAWTVEIDPLAIYAGTEAETYAASHDTTLPDNGILFVDPTDETSIYPLASAAVIQAWSGDLMDPAYFKVTPAQLQTLARGDEVPGITAPWQNIWEAVIRNGEITQLTLMLIAD